MFMVKGEENGFNSTDTPSAQDHNGHRGARGGFFGDYPATWISYKSKRV